MSYPRTFDEAVSYCEAMSSHLKEGGRFVGFGNNPFDNVPGMRDLSLYGLKKETQGDAEGSRVLYFLPGMTDPIVNILLKPETYQRAFARAGFKKFRWVQVQLSPSKEIPDWAPFFNPNPPFIAIEAVKE